MIWSRTSASRRAAPRSCPTACTDVGSLSRRALRARAYPVRRRGQSAQGHPLFCHGRGSPPEDRRGYALRVAGGVTPRVAEQSLCRGLEFLGRIPRDRLREGVRRGGRVRAALAAGRDRPRRPTKRSRPACPWSRRVPPAQSCAMASRDGSCRNRTRSRSRTAIAEIVEDRDKRARMSVAARRRARLHLGALWRAAHWRLKDPAGLTRHGTSAGAASLTAPTDGSRRSQCHAARPQPRMAGLYLRWQATRVAMQRSPCTTIAAWARSAASPLSVISGSGAMVFRQAEMRLLEVCRRTLPAGRRTTAVDVGAHLGTSRWHWRQAALMRSTRSNQIRTCTGVEQHAELNARLADRVIAHPLGVSDAPGSAAFTVRPESPRQDRMATADQCDSHLFAALSLLWTSNLRST